MYRQTASLSNMKNWWSHLKSLAENSKLNRQHKLFNVCIDSKTNCYVHLETLTKSVWKALEYQIQQTYYRLSCIPRPILGLRNYKNCQSPQFIFNISTNLYENLKHSKRDISSRYGTDRQIKFVGATIIQTETIKILIAVKQWKHSYIPKVSS